MFCCTVWCMPVITHRVMNCLPQLMLTQPAKHVSEDAAFFADLAIRMVLQTWWSILGRGGACKKGTAAPGLVLDIGANFGYYALYSAAMGCRYTTQ